MSFTKMSNAWYFKRNQMTLGPFTFQQLKELVYANKILVSDLIKNGHEGQWAVVSDKTELFGNSKDTPSRPKTPPPPLPFEVSLQLKDNSHLSNVKTYAIWAGGGIALIAGIISFAIMAYLLIQQWVG